VAAAAAVSHQAAAGNRGLFSDSAQLRSTSSCQQVSKACAASYELNLPPWVAAPAACDASTLLPLTHHQPCLPLQVCWRQSAAWIPECLPQMCCGGAAAVAFTSCTTAVADATKLLLVIIAVGPAIATATGPLWLQLLQLVSAAADVAPAAAAYSATFALCCNHCHHHPSHNHCCHKRGHYCHSCCPCTHAGPTSATATTNASALLLHLMLPSMPLEPPPHCLFSLTTANTTTTATITTAACMAATKQQLLPPPQSPLSICCCHLQQPVAIRPVPPTAAASIAIAGAIATLPQCAASAPGLQLQRGNSLAMDFLDQAACSGLVRYGNGHLINC